MSDSIQIEVSGDAQAYLKTLSDPNKVYSALSRAMDNENQYTWDHIRARYMQFSKAGPTTMDGLRMVSNRLRNSLRASKARMSSDGIYSAIGSNVVYAGILEEGGTTKPHVIEAKNGKALHFNGIFRRKVNHPGSRIEGRHYVRRGIEDRLPNYSAAYVKAIFSLK